MLNYLARTTAGLMTEKADRAKATRIRLNFMAGLLRVQIKSDR